MRRQSTAYYVIDGEHRRRRRRLDSALRTHGQNSGKYLALDGGEGGTLESLSII